MNKQQRRAYHRESIRQGRTAPPKATPIRDKAAHQQKINQVMQSKHLHDSKSAPGIDYQSISNNGGVRNTITLFPEVFIKRAKGVAL